MWTDLAIRLAFSTRFMVVALPTLEVEHYLTITSEITFKCKKNITEEVYLPFGSGLPDAKIILVLIDNNSYTCKISVSSSQKNGIIVAEIFNYEMWNTTCLKEGGGFHMFYNDWMQINTCEDLKKNNVKIHESFKIYTNVYDRNNFELRLEFLNFFGSVKITITSARRLEKDEDCGDKEVFCSVHGKVFCLNSRLACDGSANCGSFELYDEDARICYDNTYNYLWIMSVYGLILLLCVILILFQIVKNCVPRARDAFFVFPEKEEENKLVLISQSLPPPHPDSDSYPSSRVSTSPSSHKRLEQINWINRKRRSVVEFRLPTDQES